ncbi:hypothetical protein ACSQ67_017051 [Phaseolus vulgaris]
MCLKKSKKALAWEPEFRGNNVCATIQCGLVTGYGGDGLGAYGCGVEGYVTYDGPGIVFFSFLHSKALKALGSAFVEAKGPSSPVQTLVGRYLQELLL